MATEHSLPAILLEHGRTTDKRTLTHLCFGPRLHQSVSNVHQSVSNCTKVSQMCTKCLKCARKYECKQNVKEMSAVSV